MLIIPVEAESQRLCIEGKRRLGIPHEEHASGVEVFHLSVPTAVSAASWIIPSCRLEGDDLASMVLGRTCRLDELLSGRRNLQPAPANGKPEVSNHRTSA